MASAAAWSGFRRAFGPVLEPVHASPSLLVVAMLSGALVLGGHIHLPYVAPLHGSIEGLARRAWAVQAGTAVSRRVRHEAGNSVNLIRWRAGAAPPPSVVSAATA